MTIIWSLMIRNNFCFKGNPFRKMFKSYVLKVIFCYAIPTVYFVEIKIIENIFIKNVSAYKPFNLFLFKVIICSFFPGEYIVKELEALYMLKKYRTLKRRYYENVDVDKKFFEFDQKYLAQKKWELKLKLSERTNSNLICPKKVYLIRNIWHRKHKLFVKRTVLSEKYS